MIQGRPSPTRQYLIQAERALARLGRGIALLRRKREALAASLFKLATPAVDANARIADRAARAHHLLALALGDLGEHGVVPVAWPARQVTVQLEPSTVWGLPAARLEGLPPVERSLAARAAPPTVTGAAAALAADAYEELLALLLRSAPEALLLRRLADALARTSRQVNALERRVAPELRGNVERVRWQLEEREREDLVRLAVAARSAPRRRPL
jgi:V/A-type H+-transporting ATPase subunit D